MIGRRTPLPEPARIVLLLTPAMLLVAVFFVGGVLQAVLQSLGRQPLLGSSTWSLDAYRIAFGDPAVRASLGLTARIAVLSTVLSTVLGVAAALLVRGLASGGRTRMTALFQSTLAIPHLVGALCIGLLLSPSGLFSRVADAVGLISSANDFPLLINDGFGWGVIAEYAWKESPFVAVIALAALSGRLGELEDVARTLGAGPLARLRHVTLPQLAPPVGAAAILVFAFAAGSYEVPRLLGRPYPATLPVVAYQRYRDTDLSARPEAMAVAVLVAVLGILVVAGYLWLASRLSRRAL